MFECCTPELALARQTQAVTNPESAVAPRPGEQHYGISTLGDLCNKLFFYLYFHIAFFFFF